MGSVNEEITRIATAKASIEGAIEECGVDVPAEDKIDTYSDYIREIPAAVFSQFNLDQVGGTNKYIKSIKQENGTISAEAGDTTSTVTNNSTALITSGGVFSALSQYQPLTTEEINDIVDNNFILMVGSGSGSGIDEALIEEASLEDGLEDPDNK